MKQLLAAIFFLTLTINPLTAKAEDGPINISTDEVHKMLDDKADVILIDARTTEKFEAEHIKGAISLPADKVDAASLMKLTDSMDKKLIFYCDSIKCTASRIAAAKAYGAGYKYVYEYLAGITEWKEKNFETVKTETKASK